MRTFNIISCVSIGLVDDESYPEGNVFNAKAAPQQEQLTERRKAVKRLEHSVSEEHSEE